MDIEGSCRPQVVVLTTASLKRQMPLVGSQGGSDQMALEGDSSQGDSD
jgi:hypothetical protein